MTAPTRGGPPQIEEAGPATGPATSTNINRAAQSSRSDVAVQLRRRRSASWRLPALACGRRDPWFYEPVTEPSELAVEGYLTAAEHLLAHGLAPAPDIPVMRIAWRRGGDDQRLARRIADCWGVVA